MANDLESLRKKYENDREHNFMSWLEINSEIAEKYCNRLYLQSSVSDIAFALEYPSDRTEEEFRCAEYKEDGFQPILLKGIVIDNKINKSGNHFLRLVAVNERSTFDSETLLFLRDHSSVIYCILAWNLFSNRKTFTIGDLTKVRPGTKVIISAASLTLSSDNSHWVEVMYTDIAPDRNTDYIFVDKQYRIHQSEMEYLTLYHSLAQQRKSKPKAVVKKGNTAKGILWNILKLVIFLTIANTLFGDYTFNKTVPNEYKSPSVVAESTELHTEPLTFVHDTVPHPSEQTETVPTDSVEESTETIIPFNSAAGNALASVMMGKNNFTMAETGTHQSLFNMTAFMQFTFESYLMPTSFCVVDMDQDGTNEIIVGIDTDVNGFRLVLHYEYGTVYGYPFGFRGLKTVSTDGLITSSSSAFESPTSRLSFSGLSVEYNNLSYAEEQAALAGWQDAEWYDFTEDNVGKFFPNMDISFTLPSAPPPSSTGKQNESFETYIDGYVKYGTEELRIRSGPGTEYEEVGRLREGTQVVILEIANSGNREWGRTDRGWVCMDYIQEGTLTGTAFGMSENKEICETDFFMAALPADRSEKYVLEHGFSSTGEHIVFYYKSGYEHYKFSYSEPGGWPFALEIRNDGDYANAIAGWEPVGIITSVYGYTYSLYIHYPMDPQFMDSSFNEYIADAHNIIRSITPKENYSLTLFN